MPFIYSELRILPPASINKTFNFSFLSQIFLLQILLKILRYYLKAISPIPIFHKLCCLSCFQGAKKSTYFSSCEKMIIVSYCTSFSIFIIIIYHVSSITVVYLPKNTKELTFSLKQASLKSS